MPDTTPSRDLASDNLMSLQSHILAEEQQHPGASGDFSWILSAIALATKTIGNKVRRARIEDVLGDFGDQRNVHDEQQKKMDVVANEIIKACLGNRANIGVLVSEEDEEPMVLRTHAEGGRYAVLFDPLDGSSNLDFSVGVGTIFSIHRLEAGHAAQSACLQATALGLSSVVVGAFDDDKVKEAVGMAENESPLYIVSVGPAARARRPRT